MVLSKICQNEINNSKEVFMALNNLWKNLIAALGSAFVELQDEKNHDEGYQGALLYVFEYDLL